MGWQRRALVRYLDRCDRAIFWRSRPPGSGKTAFALRVAGELLPERTVDQITVVVPTEHLKIQWAASAAASASRSTRSSPTRRRRHPSEYHGVVVTTPRVASAPVHATGVRTESHRTRRVVFDEIHHGGDAKSWGEAIREAFGDATRAA